MKMRIVVLGATGQTGHAFCCQAVEKEHEVVAVVRDSAKMNGMLKLTPSDKLKVIQSDVFNPTELSGHLRGADAVVSCLGSKFVMPWQQQSSFYTDSMLSIVSAMRDSNVNRLVCISAALIRSEQPSEHPDFKKLSTMFRKFVRSVAACHLKDMERMEDFLMQSCSDINYSIMRPYALISKPMSSREVAIETDTDQLENSAFHIYRENLAHEMLTGLEQGLWSQKTVCLAMRC